MLKTYTVKARKITSFDDVFFRVSIIEDGKEIAHRTIARRPEEIEYSPDGEEIFFFQRRFPGTNFHAGVDDVIRIPSNIMREAILKADAY